MVKYRRKAKLKQAFLPVISREDPSMSKKRKGDKKDNNV
jgi:hypothetical protein